MINLPFPIVLSGICNNSIIGGEGQFDYVGVDSLRGIYMSTKHLIQQGHKKIGYVGLPSKVQIWDERFKGFCLAMEDSGLLIDEKIVITGGYDQNFGYEAGLKLAALDELPTAICASTDMTVLGLYRAFEEKGISIPNDICIVGMDNIDITTLVRPKISSVAIAQADIGRTAAELIFKRLDGLNEPNRNIIFQPVLIVRESSVRQSK
jgi:LacI family transcriptional regulator